MQQTVWIRTSYCCSNGGLFGKMLWVSLTLIHFNRNRCGYSYILHHSRLRPVLLALRAMRRQWIRVRQRNSVYSMLTRIHSQLRENRMRSSHGYVRYYYLAKLQSYNDSRLCVCVHVCRIQRHGISRDENLKGPVLKSVKGAWWVKYFKSDVAYWTWSVWHFSSKQMGYKRCPSART